jgi:hypothetical protein
MAALATPLATFCKIHPPMFMRLARGDNFVRSVVSDCAAAIDPSTSAAGRDGDLDQLSHRG